MDLKAVCDIVFEDKRVERSQTTAGVMTIELRLECWETSKPACRRFIVATDTKVYRERQYALEGMEGDGSKQVTVHDATELYLCPVDTTPSDAIRIALGMWEDPNPVRELFNRLLTDGKLALKHQHAVQEA